MSGSFQMWGRMIKENRLLKDITVTRDDDTRTHRVFGAVDDICREWNLQRPIWLDSNISEFKRLARTKFRRDSFIEDIDFDCLEIMVIEE